MLVPLPETLTPAESTAAGGNDGGVRRKKEFSWAQGNPIGSLLVLFENPTIRRALAIDVIGGVSLAGVQSVQGLQQPQRVPQQLHCPLPDAVAPVP